MKRSSLKERVGIYYLESAEFAQTPNSSVQYILGLSKSKKSFLKYFSFANRSEFLLLLSKWSDSKIRKRFPVLVISSHGSAECIEIYGIKVYLSEIASQLKSKCLNSLVHFSSCLTLSCDKRYIEDFLKETGFVCVSGYKNEIPLDEVSIFENIYLNVLANSVCEYDADLKAIHYFVNRFYEYVIDLGLRIFVRAV